VKNNPLGIFDSGIGGLTILKKVMELLPHEDTVYFGDTARLPYGEKSPESIIRYSLQNAHFLSLHKIKLLVIACHTASAYSAKLLREQFSIPVIDVIEPAIACAVEASISKKIAVLGTRATINSGIYEKKIKECKPDAEIISVACPLLVPLVEENFLSHRATKLIIQEYLKPIIHKKFDTVILGCTHYPRLFPLIQEVLGVHVTIIDSAAACAQEILNELKRNTLAKPPSEIEKRQYYVSDDPEKFKRLGENFLGKIMERVSLYKEL